jgi:hypothetical protein
MILRFVWGMIACGVVGKLGSAGGDNVMLRFRDLVAVKNADRQHGHNFASVSQGASVVVLLFQAQNRLAGQQCAHQRMHDYHCQQVHSFNCCLLGDS